MDEKGIKPIPKQSLASVKKEKEEAGKSMAELFFGDWAV